MQVISDVLQSNAEFKNVVLTIGSFDGIHAGHQKVISRVIEEARRRGGTSALLTLRPHPRQIFAPNTPPNLLMDDRQKERCLRDLGLDVLWILPFTRETAAWEPETFVERILCERCRAVHVVVGHDFAFGHKARGDFALLQSLGESLGFTVEQVPPLIIEGERVSSTLIRELILEGELERAARLLTRPYAVAGIVQKGRGIGRELGFPTANLKPDGYTVPAHGVYAAKAYLDGECYIAAVNIGIAPTIRHDDVLIEAFLLDYSGNLLGRRIEVAFYKRLRPEKKFSSYEALRNAIDEDVAWVRQYFHDTALENIVPEATPFFKRTT